MIGLIRYGVGEPVTLHVQGVGSIKLCLRVREKGETIGVGDMVWWRSCWLYWTPKRGPRIDVRLARVGAVFTPDGAEA